MLPGPSGSHASSSVPLALLLDAAAVNGAEVVCDVATPGRLKTGMAATSAAAASSSDTLIASPVGERFNQ